MCSLVCSPSGCVFNCVVCLCPYALRARCFAPCPLVSSTRRDDQGRALARPAHSDQLWIELNVFVAYTRRAFNAIPSSLFHSGIPAPFAIALQAFAKHLRTSALSFGMRWILPSRITLTQTISCMTTSLSSSCVPLMNTNLPTRKHHCLTQLNNPCSQPLNTCLTCLGYVLNFCLSLGWWGCLGG